MTQFTKKAIINTFGEMLYEMPFDKITVSALVKRCGIMPQPTKAIISKKQKSGIRKGSNRASTGKVGALLLSIYSIIVSLRFCNRLGIMEASGGAVQ